MTEEQLAQSKANLAELLLGAAETVRSQGIELSRIRQTIRQLVAELRSDVYPWHLSPKQVADRLEAMLEDRGMSVFDELKELVLSYKRREKDPPTTLFVGHDTLADIRMALPASAEFQCRPDGDRLLGMAVVVVNKSRHLEVGPAK